MKTTKIYPTSSYNLVNTMPIAEGIKSRNEIFNELINGFDMSAINIKDLSREQLIEYAYALDLNGDWDECKDGQLPITKEELIDSINNMNYSQFLFSQLLRDLLKTNHPIEYDTLFEVSSRIYKDYDESNYNDSNKDEYSCMVSYIENNTEKLLTYFN